MSFRASCTRQCPFELNKGLLSPTPAPKDSTIPYTALSTNIATLLTRFLSNKTVKYNWNGKLRSHKKTVDALHKHSSRLTTFISPHCWFWRKKCCIMGPFKKVGKLFDCFRWSNVVSRSSWGDAAARMAAGRTRRENKTSREKRSDMVRQKIDETHRSERDKCSEPFINPPSPARQI